jgi:hypothetical protein
MPRDEEVTQRAGSLRALTGLTEAEFQALRPPVEQAFVTSMHDRTIDGQPRTSRRYRTYDTCPLPTLADTRLFMLCNAPHESSGHERRPVAVEVVSFKLSRGLIPQC